MKNTKSPEETETEIARVDRMAEREEGERKVTTMFWFDKKYNWCGGKIKNC